MDNLEFLQWMKKFWDSNYSGNSYDAIGRRKSSPAASLAIASTSPTPFAPSNKLKTSSLRQSNSTASINPTSTGSHAIPDESETINSLQSQISKLQEAFALERIQSEGMQKERDFYFEKLREIEYAMQQVTEQTVLDSELYKLVNTILYKTEEGFDLPATAST